MRSTCSLDESLHLEHLGDGHSRTVAHESYIASNGMFGGWTAAILFKAVAEDPRSSGMPAAFTINYVNRVPPGAKLSIFTQPIAQGRTVTHWRTDLREADSEAILATATTVFADRRPGKRFLENSMPEVPAPKTNNTFSPPGTFGQQVEIVPLRGFPPINQPDTVSLAWAREKSGRKIDHTQLTFLADIYPPRIWYTLEQPCPMATLALSVYFFATDAELDDVGDNFVLTEATGTRGEGSGYGSRANIWSRSGALLATTEQFAWYKDQPIAWD